MSLLPQWELSRHSEGLIGYHAEESMRTKARWANGTQNRGAMGPVWLEKKVHVSQRQLIR